MQINTDFDIGDIVKMKPLDYTGKVIAIYFADSRLQYRIKYFVSGKVEFEYFDSDELEITTTEHKLGFLNN